MKDDCASATALLIARGLLLADATPALQPLVVEESVVWVRRFLSASESRWWFDFAPRHRTARFFLRVAERLLLPGILLHWLARKRLLEAHALEAIDAGCRQIVVLGAGLDTLAWRMQSAALCFELDHPATQSIKRRALAEGPTLLPADLAHDSVAEALGAQPRFANDRPTLFVAEGLLMYLPPGRVAGLFRELATMAAPGSRLAFTFMEARPGQPLAFHNASRLITWWLARRGEPFRWGLERENVAAFVAQQGWQLAGLSSPEELRRRFLAPHGLERQPLAIGESVAVAHLRCDERHRGQ